MKFVDLQKEYQVFKPQIDKAMNKVKKSGRYLFGSEVEKLEKEFASLIGVENAVSVGNGTDALILVFSYIKYLCKQQLPIILPNFGAYPTAVACGHFTDDLHYVDVDSSMTIDVNKLPDIRNCILVVVHLHVLDSESYMEYF